MWHISGFIVLSIFNTIGRNDSFNGLIPAGAYFSFAP
jgi:hypothetical protein